MVIGRKQGIGILILGLLLLTGGILVLVVAPSWGSWIADYPASVLQGEIPQEAAPVVQSVLGIILGPMLVQVGGYLQTAGYFIGSLLTLMALALTSVGTIVLTRRNAA